MKPNFNPSPTLRGGTTEVVAGAPLRWTDAGARCTIEVMITPRLAGGDAVGRTPESDTGTKPIELP